MKLKKHKCIWQNCRKMTVSWFCETHYLAKEALYGIYDLEDTEHYASKEDQKHFQKWAVQRLLQFSKHIINEI